MFRKLQTVSASAHVNFCLAITHSRNAMKNCSPVIMRRSNRAKSRRYDCEQPVRYSLQQILPLNSKLTACLSCFLRARPRSRPISVEYTRRCISTSNDMPIIFTNEPVTWHSNAGLCKARTALSETAALVFISTSQVPAKQCWRPSAPQLMFTGQNYFENKRTFLELDLWR